MAVNFKDHHLGAAGPTEVEGKGTVVQLPLSATISFPALPDLAELGGLDLIGAALNHKL